MASSVDGDEEDLLKEKNFRIVKESNFTDSKSKPVFYGDFALKIYVYVSKKKTVIEFEDLCKNFENHQCMV